jgi:UDP-glucose 4-epimerase
MLSHSLGQAEKPARVVILGSSGFVGSTLAQVLDRDGVAVRGVARKELDLTEPSAAERLAAMLKREDALVVPAGLTPDKGRTIGTLMANLRMAESVAAALERARVAHFIYISSDAVYDARFSSLLNEDSTCEPADLYALMHTAREKMLGQVCAAAKVPFAVVRPCALYGAGDTHNSYGPNRFVRSALRDGKITLFGEGEERRHHVAVQDAAEILRLCLQWRSTGTLNIAGAEAVSFREAADTVAAAAGRPVKIECLPRANPITHRHYDTTATLRAFPQFQPIALAAGVARMVREMTP